MPLSMGLYSTLLGPVLAGKRILVFSPPARRPRRACPRLYALGIGGGGVGTIPLQIQKVTFPGV